MSMYKNNKRDGGYHLGHVFMEKMSSKAPDGICTIDAATGKKETYGSVLSRSIALAVSLRRAGLQPGDVLLLSGTLHDIHIPHYSALLNGLPIISVHPDSKYDELKAVFELTTPKIAFCQQEAVDLYNRVAQDVGIDVIIVTFDDGECTLSKFLETYGDNEATDEFMPAEFDTEKIYAWLICTSGTTGKRKCAAFKHKDVIEKMFKITEILGLSEDSTKLMCDFSHLEAISSYINTIFPVVSQRTMLISSFDNIEDIINAINKYRPAVLRIYFASMIRIMRNEKCDMTCFDKLFVIGARVPKRLLTELRSRMRPGAAACENFGMTETIGPVFLVDPKAPLGSCGVSSPDLPVKLVDLETGMEITQPNVTGELLYKGPCFTEYYKNPEETAKAFTEDGWYKTGDLLYRDDNNNYYFVDRTKLIMKCNGNVLPSEVEEVILRHRGVQEACVIGILDQNHVQHPVACVVRNPGCEVTAQEIKDLVAEKLSASKQLRGGVVFLDELPMTSTGKVARSTLEQIVLQAHRE